MAASQTIIIRVQQIGAQQAASGIAAIGTAAKSSNSSLQFLQRSLAGVAGALGAREILQAADAYTNLGNRTRVFAKDSQDAAASLNGIIDVAIRSRTSLEAVSETFQRFSLVGRAAGKSTEELLRVTETLAKATVVSGATTQEAEGALRQLAQAYGANRLSGQEFNSVAEQTPIIARAIADELGVGTDQLRRFANEGKITRDVLDRSFTRLGELVDSLFARTNVTFAQAFTNVNTAIAVFVGRLNEASGAGNLLISALQGLTRLLVSVARDTDTLNAIIRVTEGLFVALALVSIPKVITGLVSIVSMFARFTGIPALIAAIGTGWGAVVLGVVAAVAALVSFRDTVFEIGGTETTIQDLAAVFFSDLGGAIKSAWDTALETLDAFDGFSGGPVDAVKTLINWIARLVALIGAAAIEVGDFLFQTGDAVVSAFASIPAALDSLKSGDFAQAGATIADAFKGGFEGGFDATEAANKILGTDFVAEATRLAGAAGDAIGGSDLFERAGARTKDRLAEQARAQAEKDKLGGGLGEGPKSGPPPIDAKTQRANDKLLESFRQLRGELDPTVALLNDYQDKNKILADTLAKFPDKAEEVAAAQALVNAEFNKAVKELPKETKEVTELRESITALRGELDPASAAASTYAERLREIGKAAEAGVVSQTQAADLARLATEAFTEAQAEIKRQNEQLALESAEGFSAIGAGFTLAAQDLTADIQSQSSIIKDGFLDAFDVAGQAFKDFVETGKIDIRSLGSEILAVAAKAIAKLAVLSALNSLSGLAGGGGLGGALGGFATSLLGRATGGPVSPGRSFLVGERGPELFTPPETGRVVPNHQLGGGAANVNVQVVNVDDPDSVPRALNTKAGEQSVLNIIQRNSRKLREVLA